MFILFDIGGTKMRIARSHDGENFDEPLVSKTPEDFNEGIALFAKTARELRGEKEIKMAAGGIAGPLDKERTMLLNSPNIPGWVKKPLKHEFEKALGTKVILENDAALVGLGEAHRGAGKGCGIVAYLTISTGVGGARIVNGKIDKSQFGFEPGHQIIDMDGTVCPSCLALTPHKEGVGGGHLEGYVSGTATQKRFNREPHNITEGEVWEELAEWLSYGLNNTIVHWSPDVVVLGGSMVVKKPGISVERVHYHLQQILTIFPECPEVKEAELADFGGLHGALARIREES